MSSVGSSISSQSAEDLSRDHSVIRQRDPPPAKIRTENERSSSPEPRYDDPRPIGFKRSSGSDGLMGGTGFNGSSYPELATSNHNQRSVANGSNGSNSSRRESSTWSEFLRESSSLTAGLGPTSDSDTMNIVAADRKRRLTASAQDSGRRTVNGGFYTRHQGAQSHHFGGSSSPPASAWPRRMDSIDRPQLAYIDLTSSPPPVPPQLGQASAARPSFVSNRQYVLPIWQPDSEASECPICKRQFSLLFRRHHCRKCGRVVCNDCSPHRITIPRQFIVHPPGPSGQTQPRSPVGRMPSATIDLTGDTDSDERPNWIRTATLGSNPALGGGEKVRLCNPCVPDPQPSPHLDPNLSRPLIAIQTPPWEGASGHAIPSTRENDLAAPPLADMYQAGLAEHGRELSGQRGRGLTFQPVGNDMETLRTRVMDASNSRAPPYGGVDNSAMPNFSRRDRPLSYRSYPSAAVPPGYHGPGASHGPGGTSAPNQFRSDGRVTASQPINSVTDTAAASPQALFPTTLRPSASMQLPMHGHARYQSLNLASRSTPPASNRPRVRSLLDADPSLQRFWDHAAASGSSRLPSDTRPRLHERDVCPVCCHALPPRGPDGDETAREAHIMECITSRDRSVPHSTSAQHGLLGPSTPPVPMRMLPFVASEKDCVGEDGNIPECSICMVEYDVGDQLARLECLCKFHKACIVEWFGRKQECPVHKIA